MGRLIDADTIVRYQTYDDEHEEFSEHESTIEDFLDKMTDEGCQNPVDAVPVKHGRWIREDYWSQGVGMGESYGYYYKCSECGNLVRGGYNECGKKYCDKCGAKNGW